VNFVGRLAYRDINPSARGTPIVFLHGGWGYEMYPFDRQIDAFTPEHRIVIPDRTGYGASPSVAALPADFHDRAVDETRTLLAAIGIDRPILWGHSDGAIIALRYALDDPARVSRVIAEAMHYFRAKPRSRGFFEAVIANPDSTAIMKAQARAWLQIGEQATPQIDDFYGGRLGRLAVAALILHGAQDPRTEPGELDAIASILPNVVVLARGGHSPHSEADTADEATAVVDAFIHD